MIKLFEEYNQYYSEVSHNEHESSTLLTDYDLSTIFNFLFKLGISRDEIITSENRSDVIPYIYYRVTSPKYYLVYIYKLVDEWYMVGSSHPAEPVEKIYKCDQIEGLIKCINNL